MELVPESTGDRTVLPEVARELTDHFNSGIMPRRPLRCVVDLSLHAVSAPGVWLPSKEDVYLSVSMFGQYRNSRLLTSIFPLLIHEKFRFEKTYYTALDPSEVADYLEDELVIFELVQLSEYTDGAVRLASFSTNARDFCYPYPSLAPTYSSTDRELLLSRTVAFPGISPKLEFSTKTTIRESLSPEVDALEDALDFERERRLSFRKSHRSPTRRARSPSPIRRLASLDLADTIDPRPPFVVRKLETDLIGRLPGGGPDTHALSKSKKSKRVPALSTDGDTDSFLNRSTSSLSRSHLHLDKVIREPLKDPVPVYRSKLDDDDAEVAALTSSRAVSTYRPRPRSASPVLYRPTFRERYGLYPYSSSYYSWLADGVSREARLARLTSPYWPYLSAYERYKLGLDPYPSYYPYRSLYDLELTTNLARSRRYIPLY